PAALHLRAVDDLLAGLALDPESLGDNSLLRPPVPRLLPPPKPGHQAIGGGLDGPLRDLPQEPGLRRQSRRSNAASSKMFSERMAANAAGGRERSSCEAAPDRSRRGV